MTDEQIAEKYGRRELQKGSVILDEPGELGYRCPRKHSFDCLTWSEFNDHLWCYVCQKDYHYANDCELIRPCWESKKQFSEFVSRLPKKPRIIGGIMHFPDCEIPHKKRPVGAMK